jgi:hypothetical protein
MSQYLSSSSASSPKTSILSVPFQLMLVTVPSTHSEPPMSCRRHGRAPTQPFPTRTTSVGDLVDRRVNGLLNKLTVEKFDQIIT